MCKTNVQLTITLKTIDLTFIVLLGSGQKLKLKGTDLDQIKTLKSHFTTTTHHKLSTSPRIHMQLKASLYLSISKEQSWNKHRKSGFKVKVQTTLKYRLLFIGDLFIHDIKINKYDWRNFFLKLTFNFIIFLFTNWK